MAGPDWAAMFNTQTRLASICFIHHRLSSEPINELQRCPSRLWSQRIYPSPRLALTSFLSRWRFRSRAPRQPTVEVFVAEGYPAVQVVSSGPVILSVILILVGLRLSQLPPISFRFPNRILTQLLPTEMCMISSSWMAIAHVKNTYKFERFYAVVVAMFYDDNLWWWPLNYWGK